MLPDTCRPRLWLWIFVLASSPLALGVCGCSAGPSEVLPPPEAPRLAPSLLARLRAGVVFIEVKDYPRDGGPVSTTWGSGVVVDASGLILTNAHVVAGGSSDRVISVRTHSAEDGCREHVARIVAADEAGDLALLAIQPGGSSLCALELASGDASLAQPVLAVGFPHGGLFSTSGRGPDMSIRPGAITRLIREEGQTLALESDVNVEPGSSGGPLVDEHGAVLGITLALVGRSCLAIPAGKVAPFLERNRAGSDIPQGSPAGFVALASEGQSPGDAGMDPAGLPLSPTPLERPTTEVILAWLRQLQLTCIVSKSGTVIVQYGGPDDTVQQVAVSLEKGRSPQSDDVTAIQLVHVVPLKLERRHRAALLEHVNRQNHSRFLVKLSLDDDEEPGLWATATLPCMYGAHREEFWSVWVTFVGTLDDVYKDAKAVLEPQRPARSD